jgi:arsenate reductase
MKQTYNNDMTHKNILIICTGNSCRSQIAEGFLKKLIPPTNVFSAGIETHGVNERAIKTSNHIDEYKDIDFSHIITVCDQANENCPVFPSQSLRHHINFTDPSKVNGTEEEIMAEFRRTRELIRMYLEEFVNEKK